MTSILRHFLLWFRPLVLLQDKPSDAQYTIGPSSVVDAVYIKGPQARILVTVACKIMTNLEVSFEYVEDADCY